MDLSGRCYRGGEAPDRRIWMMRLMRRCGAARLLLLPGAAVVASSHQLNNGNPYYPNKNLKLC